MKNTPDQDLMPPDCELCQKPLALCMCDQIKKLQTKKRVLILQHPQEPDKELGTAVLAHRMLPQSALRVGLSWPNLKKALGEEAIGARWAVLYLGSGIKVSEGQKSVSGLNFVDRAGQLVAAPLPGELLGIVVLDGTWSQAKTLWWRNAWLLKLKRAVLVPSRASLYRELRKEPRRECLSTLESIAEALTSLGEPATVGDGLRGVFGELLDRKRELKKSSGQANSAAR